MAFGGRGDTVSRATVRILKFTKEFGWSATGDGNAIVQSGSMQSGGSVAGICW